MSYVDQESFISQVSRSFGISVDSEVSLAELGIDSDELVDMIRQNYDKSQVNAENVDGFVTEDRTLTEIFDAIFQ